MSGYRNGPTDSGCATCMVTHGNGATRSTTVTSAQTMKIPPIGNFPYVCCVAACGSAVRGSLALRSAITGILSLPASMSGFVWPGLDSENLTPFFPYFTSSARRRRARDLFWDFNHYRNQSLGLRTNGNSFRICRVRCRLDACRACPHQLVIRQRTSSCVIRPAAYARCMLLWNG